MDRIKLYFLFSLVCAFTLMNCNSVDPMTNDPDPEPEPMEEALTVTFAAPEKINQGTELTFATSSTGNPDTYEWTFGGAFPSDSSDEEPTVVFSEYGTHEISLTVSRMSDGSSVTLVKEVFVCLSDGLVASFPLNGDATDATSSGFDGTINGATSIENADGDADSAMNFNGVDDYISTSASIDELLTGGFTFSAWINPTESGTAGRILSNYNGDSTGGDCLQRVGISFTLTDIDGLRITYASDGNDYIGRNSGGDILNIGEWQHVVATWNGELTAESYALYLNGVKADVQNYEAGSICTPYIDSPRPMEIGRHVCAAGPCAFFKGGIDNVTIYDRVLSDEEIAFLAN